MAKKSGSGAARGRAKPGAKAAKPGRAAKPGKAARTAKPAKPPRAAAKARAKPAKPPRTAAKARPAKRPAPMFQKVAFTMFAVDDPMRARTFYEEVLGLSRGLASPDGAWTEYDLAGGGCLALFRHPDPASARPPGGASVAFEVADLDALNERLTAAGVVYQGGVIHGPRCRMSNILDSEGNSIILHELSRDR
jgi:predicted enzyme related to lactoylglutathione lyase